jgi:hypothetical protein
MKLINIKKLALVSTSLLVLATGCKTDFDINASEENLTAGSLNYRDVMPSAIASTAKIVAADWKFLQNWMGYWARSGNYQNDNEEETYTFTNSFPGTNNPWNDLYYNASSYNYVQQRAQASGDGFYEAIARVMKAHNFQILTDVYGNIPYKQALKGNDVRNPKYDKGVDIYNDIFRQLDTAIAILNDPAKVDLAKNDKIATNDLVFKGNPALWVKFANTLKLRMLVHCKGGGVEVGDAEYTTSGVDIAGEMAIITAEGSGFLGAGESAKINPGYSASKPNPFYRNYALNENGVLAGQGDLTKGNAFACGIGAAGTPGYYRWNGDPREAKFYVKPDLNPDAGVYQAATYQKGIPYGAVSGFAPGFAGADLSSINVINLTAPNTGLTPNGPSSDAWIITSVESLFLQAEAAERGIMTGDAEALLTAAIRESFTFLGLTSAQADTYITNNATYPDVDYNADALDPSLPAGGLFTIISQKWFALNGIATFEIWSDYRRTNIIYGAGGAYDVVNAGIWANQLSTLTGAAAEIPVRLFYPQSEYSYNEANVSAEGNIDVFTSKVFWDR